MRVDAATLASEEKKATLKAMLEAELGAVLKQRLSLRLVKLADGAKDNWTFLSQALPPGDEILDFYHAAEHLSGAIGAGCRSSTDVTRRVILNGCGARAGPLALTAL